ncbi:MAG: 50S ribosomal protein L29 [Phycisphaeraceae bacterium]|nr:50S ribosomal protein L29 [Phycisphaeraceae bacterium]
MAKKKEDPLSADKVRALSDEEIGLEIQRQREALYSLKTKAVTEKVEDTSEFGKVRKRIARLATERTARRHRKTVRA